MSLPKSYNPRFIQYWQDNARPDLQTLGEYGVSILKHADPAAFRVIGIHHLSGSENRGNHHIYCDVLDENGARLNGSLIKVQVGNNPPTYATVDKPASEPGTNVPMWANTKYAVSVDGHPSDTAIGLHTGHSDEPGGNFWGHHSFYVVWQRRPVQFVPEPPPVVEPPVTVPPDDYTEALGLVVQALIELRTQVEALAADVATVKALVQAHDQRVKKTAAVWQQ